MANFYFAYFGNKRTEFKYIEDVLKELEYKTFIEPFCGSCSTSYNNYYKNDKKVKYILNDIDKDLTDFLNDVMINGSKKYFDYCNENNKDLTKEKYKKLIDKYKDEKHTSYDYFYYNKVYQMRRGGYPDPKYRKMTEYEHKKYIKYDDFFKSTDLSITNEPYFKTIEKYKNDPDALIYLDPPYFDSCNSSYIGYEKQFKISGEHVKDNTHMYSYIAEFIKNCKCKVIMVINKCSILHYIYKDNFYISYEKTYSTTKNKTEHMVILKR